MLTYNGKEYDTLKGETYYDAVKRHGLKGVLAVQLGGRPMGLNEHASRNAAALTLAQEEGRRIYERSLRFVMLMAFSRLFPGAHLRFDNSFGHGILVSTRGIVLSDENVAALETEMRSITDAALPFTMELLSKDEAIEYYSANNMPDKAAVLKYRAQEYIRMFECGGYKEYFYGEMTHDTSDVSAFGLTKVGDNVVLRLPDYRQPDEASPFKPMPKLLEVFNESNEWLKILKVENVAELNALTESGKLREFIRINEALMDMRINKIAESIIQKGSRLVLIAGPSSSGKTTFCNRLDIALRVHGLTPVKLSLDNYYLDRDKAPLDEFGKPDLECVEALDTALINEQLAKILAGEKVAMPVFDFETQKRSSETITVQVPSDAPIIIEGIHGLNEQLTSLIPAKDKFKIYISALTNINVDDHNRIRTTDARLIRRIVRDSMFRGTEVQATLEMWDSVRRGEEKYIFPFQEEADAMINSSLVYELAIVKKYVYKQLMSVTEDKPYYSIARRLVKFLNYVKSAEVDDEVPLNSLLREFIGGSCFYREE